MTTAASSRRTSADSMTALPTGFRLEFDPDTRQLTDSILFGGSPARAMRLWPAGCLALAELRAGPVGSSAAGLLARRLTDAGLAHPRPPACATAPDLTVLIPAKDRTGLLGTCLTAVGGQHPVIVVDDGSADPAAVAAVAHEHGAALHRRPAAGGPAAARNTGLAAVRTEFVAFLDSDCVPPPGWLEQLAAHFTDPLVGAVAPRIVAAGAGSRRGHTVASRYSAARGSLDLGPREARVLPASRVAYVPTAALVVRRTALESLPGAGQVFDESLRYGEDVDLIWRLHDRGWRIRYEPAVEVAHDGPRTWPALLSRRFRYGTSAGPLARRHPGRLMPLVLQPWPTVTVAALLARRPVAGVAAATAGWLSLTHTVRRAGIPADGAAAATVTATRQTWLGIGKYATQFGAPVLLLAMRTPGGTTALSRIGRRVAVASLLAGPALDAWRQCRPALDPVRFTLGHIADDVAYGAGVWAGCVRARTLAPVTPVISCRPLRISGPAPQTARTGKEGNAADAQHLV